MSILYTPRTWVAGEVVTAAEMNTEVRDAMTGVQAVWTGYIPTWTAVTTNPVIGNGTNLGRWLRYGKTLNGLNIQITAGSTTTFGTGNWLLTLPVSPVLSTHLFLTGTAFDSSAGVAGSFPIWLQGDTTTSFTVREFNNVTPGLAGVQVAAASPMTWAVGDILTINYGALELP